MDTALHVAVCLSAYTMSTVNSVPPAACFANFRWDDCGKPPVPVMYYWKPGSRCEVGMWRGCLPNINMFQDEYECVSTCVFTARAQPQDYHNALFVSDYEGGNPETTVADLTEGHTDGISDGAVTNGTNAVSGQPGETSATGSGSKAADDAKNSTEAGGDAAKTTAAM